MSHLVDNLLAYIRVLGLPEPVQEHRFAAPKRQWRFDLCWPEKMLAAEVHGGLFLRRGHHSGGANQEADFEKLNAALDLGWRVLQFGPKQIKSGYAIETIARALGQNREKATGG